MNSPLALKTEEKPNRIAEGVKELAAATRGELPPLDSPHAEEERQKKIAEEERQERVDAWAKEALWKIAPMIINLVDEKQYKTAAQTAYKMAWEMEHARAKGDISFTTREAKKKKRANDE